MNRIVFHLILIAIIAISCESQNSNSFEEAKGIETKNVEKTHPKRIKQKFITSFENGDTLTVKSFHGESGVEYSTYEEAVWNNDNSFILIKNVEHNGASEWNESFLVNKENIEESFSPVHENYDLNQSLLKFIWGNINKNNYTEIIKKGLAKESIKLETLEKIGNLIKSKPKTSWKLNMKRINKDIIKYSLFAYPPRFHGDPVFPPFLEIETSIDNSKDPRKLSSLNLNLDAKINMDKFEEIGINPEYIK